MALSITQSLRMAAVLRECSEQLDLLGHALILQIDRKGGSAPTQEKARLTKLNTDCQLISQHISKLYSELGQKHNFTSLQEVIEEEEQIKKAESMRREEKEMLKQRKDNLQRKQGEIDQKHEKLEDMNQLTKALYHQLNKKSSEITNKKTMIAKTIELQLQQSHKETGQTEKLQEEHLELLQKQLQWERRVHEELKMFLQNENKGLQQKLSQWQEHSKQMQWEMEQQLNNVQCNRTINSDRLMEKMRKFREMEQVVVEDRDKLMKLQLQQAEARAAIKLQAWWRGCLVRHDLHTFGKSEEDKKGKRKMEGKSKRKK
ncbi:dynein regulatory complex protein 9 [Notolabrus celidotus]|uniref:dynein regulatory complex protein 9 n=1 Tax=Notolabrus celidotus TaxID=1203425 RepID=UPI0014905662|nr:dynein regulatory complex protein 9 [Notolabrus celidotus]XP_034554666.1 dynein regulatory complex protein 9 [Notolabrus celidotus]